MYYQGSPSSEFEENIAPRSSHPSISVYAASSVLNLMYPVPQITKRWDKERQKLGIDSESSSSVSGSNFRSLFRSILSLEQEYLKKLEILIQVRFQLARLLISEIGIDPLIKFKLMSEESIEKLFSCVRAVSSVHTVLYQSLLSFYNCPYHTAPSRLRGSFWDYHRNCDIGELFLQKVSMTEIPG